MVLYAENRMIAIRLWAISESPQIVISIVSCCLLYLRTHHLRQAHFGLSNCAHLMCIANRRTPDRHRHRYGHINGTHWLLLNYLCALACHSRQRWPVVSVVVQMKSVSVWVSSSKLTARRRLLTSRQCHRGNCFLSTFHSLKWWVPKENVCLSDLAAFFFLWHLFIENSQVIFTQLVMIQLKNCLDRN